MALDKEETKKFVTITLPQMDSGADVGEPDFDVYCCELNIDSPGIIES
jgi:hypothetical protein